MISRLLLVGTFGAVLAAANPLIITVSGIGSGSLGDNKFTSAAFTFTLSTDTTLVAKPPHNDTKDTPSGTKATFSIAGLGNGTLTGNQAIFISPSDGWIGLAHYNDGDLIDLQDNALIGYTFGASIGPLTGKPSFVGACPGGSDCTSFNTSAGFIKFSSVSTVTFTIVVGTAQTPAITNVVNGASFKPGIQGNSWITVQGTNLSASTRIWDAATEIINGNLPTTLDGVSATVNGKAAVVYYISSNQLNLLAPDDAATGPVLVSVTTTGGTSAPVIAQLQQYSPAFFHFEPQTGKYAAALIARKDGKVDYLGPVGLFGSALATRPVKPGEIILLYGTGCGPTNPPVPFGVVFTSAAPLADGTVFTLTIGGVPATVNFKGVTGAGLCQFNVVVPALPDGDQKVVATIGGLTSQDNLFVTVGN